MKTINTATAIALAGTIALLGVAAAAGAARSVEMAGSQITPPRVAADTADRQGIFPRSFDASQLTAAKLPSSETL